MGPFINPKKSHKVSPLDINWRRNKLFRCDWGGLLRRPLNHRFIIWDNSSISEEWEQESQDRIYRAEAILCDFDHDAWTWVGYSNDDTFGLCDPTLKLASMDDDLEASKYLEKYFMFHTDTVGMQYFITQYYSNHVDYVEIGAAVNAAADRIIAGF